MSKPNNINGPKLSVGGDDSPDPAEPLASQIEQQRLAVCGVMAICDLAARSFDDRDFAMHMVLQNAAFTLDSISVRLNEIGDAAAEVSHG